MPGLPEFFATLRRLNIGFVLATNNATKVATQYTEKLARFGVDVPTEAILTSAEATADHLQEQYGPGTTVYVVGETGLRTAMRRRGFELLESDDFVGAGARTDLVVVGFTRHVCYLQLASAAHLINNGARFVGTNPDVTFPAEAGPMPGAGSLLAFLQAATAQEPTVIGKPGRAIFLEALDRLGST
ncbi:MAG: haloacid dehalogenase, partial [Chloroflexota bacterium]